MKKCLLFLLIPFITFGKPPENTKLYKHPGKIIRTCCSFGVDVKVVAVPFVKVTEITEPNLLGNHTYLGDKSENNGIIYTRKGGFIDFGHLRDIADYTAYLYNLIQEHKDEGLKDFKLGREAGLKTISFQIPSYFSDEDIANLAGRMAYTISSWHEISTWFGASYVPLVPERYSSFSIEDAYSNLMGVQLAIKAILSLGEYESEMDKNILEMLKMLDAVDTIEETRMAMNIVKDIWWSAKARMPSRKVLLKREFDFLESVSPWLIDTTEEMSGMQLEVPKLTSNGELLNDYFTFSIKYNHRIPMKKIYSKDFNDKSISQNDYLAIVAFAKKQDKLFWEKKH